MHIIADVKLVRPETNSATIARVSLDSSEGPIDLQIEEGARERYPGWRIERYRWKDANAVCWEMGRPGAPLSNEPVVLRVSAKPRETPVFRIWAIGFLFGAGGFYLLARLLN